VLLDFGLAEELSPEVRQHFISFLHCIARGARLGNTAACMLRRGSFVALHSVTKWCGVCNGKIRYRPGICACP